MTHSPSSPATEQLRELAQQLLDAAHYSTELSRLEGHCRDIAHKIECLAEGSDDAAATPSESLAGAIAEYARDLRRNSSGCDDYPWEYAKATADYLEELIRRSGIRINLNHAVLVENAQQVMPDLGPDWVPDNPHIAAMFAPTKITPDRGDT